MSGIETNDGLLDRYPFKESLAAGAVAFVAGLASIFALVQADSDLGETVDGITANFEEAGAGTFDAIIWLFFSAQSVNLEETQSMGGERQFTESFNLFAFSETSLPEAIYTVLPLLILVVAGYAVIYLAGAQSTGDAALFGGLLIVGYLPLTAIALFLSRVSSENQQTAETVAVDPLAGILLVGLALPAFFGAIGGLIAFKQFGTQQTDTPQPQPTPPQQQAPPQTNQPPSPPQPPQPPQGRAPQQNPPRGNRPPEGQPPQQPPANQPPQGQHGARGAQRRQPPRQHSPPPQNQGGPQQQTSPTRGREAEESESKTRTQRRQSEAHESTSENENRD